MKNLASQIIFAIAILIAVVSSGCIGTQTGPDTSIDSQDKDKRTALQRLNVKREGIQRDKHYIYSIKCWRSMMESIGLEFAQQAAQQQLVEMCPNTQATISGSQQQVRNVGMYTCVLIAVPIEGVNCK